MLLLVEDHDLFLAEGVPGRGRAALEGALLDLRVAPDDEVRATAERTTVDEPRREVGRERLSVVDRGPVVIPAVEGVLTGDRGLRVRGRRPRCARGRCRPPGWCPSST